MSNFGITTETKSRNLTPIEPPYKGEDGKYIFPKAYLLSVKSHIFTNKDSEESKVLDFHFKATDGKEYIHREFLINEDDAKYQTKADGFNTRVKHIYEAFAVFPEKGIGTKAKNWEQYFDMIAKAFEGVYEKSLVHIKVIYFNGRAGFPLSPNFLEKVVEDRPYRTLSVNLKYDVIEQVSASSSTDDDDTPSNFKEDDFDFEDEGEKVF